MAFLGLSVH